MPRRCTVCSHPDRAAIDAALVAGQEANRDIALRFGVNRMALWRHRDDHLPRKLAQAQEAREVAQADKLLDELRSIRGKAYSLLLKAEQTGDYRAALAGVREARGCLELLAKLQGQLDERPTVNVLLAPEWLAVRAAVIDALEAYPEARIAVAARLHAMEAS